MDNIAFEERKKTIVTTYEQLITRKNYPLLQVDNGIYKRYEHPVVTAAHAPYFWKYDLHPETNPFLEERFGVNAAFNAGAIYLNGKFLLVVRVEGADRKSFFAVAESENGVDNFRFWEKPILLPKSDPTETNIYDMRLTAHEDGWIYGVFCVEKKDPEAPASDKSSAIAQCGIVRTKDLKNWERLPDLKTSSPQQRNVVLHSEFVHGKYAFYTRPQDGFISTGSGGGIGFGLSDTIENPYVAEESIVDARHYHTISELKNGLGPAPIKTKEGWLHLAHGVRNTAAGLRYVLYLFMTSLEDPSKILYKPAGCFMAPEGEERIGDVSNVLFSNGWIVTEDRQIYIYYASSDTRMHVATSTIAQLVDYVKNTAPDGLYSNASVSVIHSIMEHNKGLY